MPAKNLPRNERLHPDWVIRVFNFDAWLLHKPPQALWETARMMQELWNECVSLFEQASALDTKDENNQPLRPKAERAAIWLPFGQRKTIRREGHEEKYDLAEQLWGGQVPSLNLLGREYRGLIPSACYEAVLARFIVTVKLWQQKKGRPPRLQKALDRLNIPIVFNEGITLPELAENGKVSLRYTEHLKSAGGDAYRSNGRFCVGVNNSPILMHVAFHRPEERLAVRQHHWRFAVPEQHRIKAVSLVGRRTRNLGWRWSLQLRIEHPPEITQRRMTDRACGLDLGWRIREDGLRVAYLADTEGREMEIVLPFVRANNHQRRAAKLIGDSFRYDDWRKLAEWQSEMDQYKDQLKAELKAMHEQEPFPEEASAVMRGYEKLGVPGLFRLAQLLPPGPALDAVTRWAEWYKVEARRRYGSEEQLRSYWANARKEIAAWLTTQYDVIVWEDELSLRHLSRKKKGKKGGTESEPTAQTATSDATLQEAQKWRARACHSDFRTRIRQGAQKRLAELRDGGTAYSSQICEVCGGAIKPSPKLLTVCENGHENDQDANTARLFCAQVQPVAGITPRSLEIPEHLRRYVRIVRGSL